MRSRRQLWNNSSCRPAKVEITLLFQDEVDLNLLPGVIGCWTQRGQQRKVPTPGQNVKRYGFGAVNFMSGQVTQHVGERKNSDNFIQLVEQMVQTYCPGETWPGPKVVLVDRQLHHPSLEEDGGRARQVCRSLAGGGVTHLLA